MALLAHVALSVPTASWEAVGFPVGTWKLGETCVSFDELESASGITADIVGVQGDLGVANMRSGAGLPSCPAGTDQLGLVSIDHLMVRTKDAESTLQSLAGSLGDDVSIDANGEQSVWIGAVRIDMVPAPDLSVPAELWGIAFRVDDIDAVAARLGSEMLGATKPARQAGQRVAVFRSGANLGVPTALIDLQG